jgi:hypothetical protein
MLRPKPHGAIAVSPLPATVIDVFERVKLLISVKTRLHLLLQTRNPAWIYAVAVKSSAR